MTFRRNKKQSPIPAVRRTAGQSLREEWDRLINDNLPFVVFGPCMLWLVWLTQWLQVSTKVEPQPQFWLAFAIITTGAAAIRFLRMRECARWLVRGERGELKVAEVLEELRAAEYQVFHDLCRDGFNIDHVVVGPAGVFVIETKFRSGRGDIEFRNGEGLFIGGVPDERDSLKQARANAADVNRLIKENCGLNCSVSPLVVFVGQWRIKNRWNSTDARVFTPDQLPTYFDRQQPQLKRSEIKLIASHLERCAKNG